MPPFRRSVSTATGKSIVPEKERGIGARKPLDMSSKALWL
jgi:hypothetical protein